MHEFEGDLLIGGMRLSHLHGELEKETHEDNALDWDFEGRIVVTPEECQCLECKRRYRLELADGRAGLVVLSRLEALDDAHIVAEFAPQKRVVQEELAQLTEFAVVGLSSALPRPVCSRREVQVERRSLPSGYVDG